MQNRRRPSKQTTTVKLKTEMGEDFHMKYESMQGPAETLARSFTQIAQYF